MYSNKNVKIIDHPFVQHKLSLMRKKDTSTAKFRTLMREISLLIGYEVTRNFPLTEETIETPLSTMQAPVLKHKQAAIISILRAGNGILDGLLQLIPTAKVGHIGLYRQHNADAVVEYYFKLPSDIQSRRVIVVDPMLASGLTAVAAVSKIKKYNPQSIEFMCLLAAPEGIEYFTEQHPDVCIYTAAIDKCLDKDKYILPGLGDAGDRLFGTI